jgi:predicted phage baseplate assembly protein
MPLNDLINGLHIDDRTFADLVAEARTRIPRYTPEWTDFNESDPGMTMVELFAWMTELLVYRLNKVPQLNYYKFLELIGFELEAARPAKAEITFPMQATYALPTVTIPMATQVTADSDDEGPVVFELDRALVAITATLDAVQVMEPPMFKDVSTANNEAKTGFAPFGNLARSGAALLLGFKSSLAFPEVELDLAFFTQPTSGTVSPATCGITAIPLSGTIVWEYWNGSDWVGMALVKDDTAAFTQDGHVRVQLPPSSNVVAATMGVKTDVARYWIRARLVQSNYQLPPKLLAIRTNTASATQAETISYEILGASDGRPKQVFTTSRKPILEGTMQVDVDEGEGFVTWTEVPDPFGSGPDDTHYVLNRSTGEVRFGDGVHGRIPVANATNPQNIRATSYRVGGGARGNVGAGALTSLQGALPGIAADKVSNPFSAGGGADEETLASAIDRAPGMLRTRDRAVTPEDFERLAKESGAIARAKALPLRHPDFSTMQVPGVVSVVVVPNVPGDAPMPNPVTLKTVCEYLDCRRLLTTELYVVPPRYRTVTITAHLIAEDTADSASVQETASATLDRYFDPLLGGEDSTTTVPGTGWPFGGGIYYSQVIRRLLVPGVKRVASLTMQLDDKVADPCGDLMIDADELLVNGDHQIQVDYEETTS